jgi:hypothetical protein
MYTVLEYPWQVGAMNDAENEGLFGTKILHHAIDGRSTISRPNRVRPAFPMLIAPNVIAAGLSGYENRARPVPPYRKFGVPPMSIEGSSHVKNTKRTYAISCELQGVLFVHAILATF